MHKLITVLKSLSDVEPGRFNCLCFILKAGDHDSERDAENILLKILV